MNKNKKMTTAQIENNNKGMGGEEVEDNLRIMIFFK